METESTIGLDSDEQSAWRAFVTAYGQLVNELDRDLVRRHEIPLSEYEVLVHLSEADEHRLRMHELAALCGLSPSGLTRRFDSMVRVGLVDREKCDDDRRGVWAVLTPAGLARLHDAAPDHVAAVRRLFIEQIDHRQLNDLADICRRITVGITNAPVA